MRVCALDVVQAEDSEKRLPFRCERTRDTCCKRHGFEGVSGDPWLTGKEGLAWEGETPDRWAKETPGGRPGSACDGALGWFGLRVRCALPGQVGEQPNLSVGSGHTDRTCKDRYPGMP